MTTTQSYVLIATLIPVGCVAVRTFIHNVRRHAEQRAIQQAKWRARFDEVRNNPDLLVNPRPRARERERDRVARVG